MFKSRKKRRVVARRKRTLDTNIIIDYKRPDTLKRFITDRGKIIPRRISGATASQQLVICEAIKRARYLSLLPYAVNHPTEKGFAGEMAAVNAVTSSYRSGPGGRPGYGGGGGRDGGGGGFQNRGERSEGGGGYQNRGASGGDRGGFRDRNQQDDGPGSED